MVVMEVTSISYLQIAYSSSSKHARGEGGLYACKNRERMVM